MKDICVWMVVVTEAFFGCCYIVRIWQRKAIPTTSTWIIFLVGCGLSFFTYMIAEDHDIRSGVLNAIDLVYIAAILGVAIWKGNRGAKFKPFEKWYLSGAGAIVAYGLISGNVWNSNVLTQVLMSVAYLPMFQKLITQKGSDDSYFAWIPQIFISVMALYPAIHGGNSLAVIYALRALTLSTATTLMMAYYQFVNPRR